MYEIDNWLDSVRVDHPVQHAVRPRPVVDSAFWVGAVPGDAVAGGAHAQVRDQLQVLFPARVVLRQLVFVEDAARARVRPGDEGVFDSGRPEEVAPRRKREGW